MRKVLFLLALLLVFSQLAYSEIITLKNGKTIDAPILERAEEYIKVNIGGVGVKYYMDEIDSVGKDKSLFKNNYSKKTPSEIYNENASAVVMVGAKGFFDTGFSIGVGSVISQDGLVVTNYHVLGDSNDVSIAFDNGSISKAISVATFDPIRDFCILKVKGSDLQGVELGDSDNLKKGEALTVITIDSNDKHKIMTGKYLYQLVDLGSRYLMAEIPTGEEGNSGSPVFNECGKVIGIYTRGDPESNLASIIPINDIKEYLNVDKNLTMHEFKNLSDQAVVLSTKGKVFMLRGEYQKALDYFYQALSINPECSLASLVLAQVYIKMHEFYKAANEINKIIQRFPDEVHHYMTIAEIYRKNFMWDDFLIAVNKAIEVDPRYSDAYAELSLYYYIVGKSIDRAIVEAKKCISFKPSNCTALTILIEIYGQKNDCVLVKKYRKQMEDYGCEITKEETIQAIQSCR
ncbi:MAG: trypsin-like peptidase domain-containing protein [Candidatus Omnitrophica bacterium]|nr:trypsin-like peptidase domain-containing protein [Candidatus Omnitrophota bacterium]